MYHLLGDMKRPPSSYDEEKLFKATLVAYRWCREAGHRFSHKLCSDILRDICRERRRYCKRIENLKYPKGSLRPARPWKDKAKHAPKPARAPMPAAPGAPIGRVPRPSKQMAPASSRMGPDLHTPASGSDSKRWGSSPRPTVTQPPTSGM